MFADIKKRCEWFAAIHEPETRGPVHATPEKFENSYFYGKAYRPQKSVAKRSFRKALFKPGKIENAGFPFECGRKTLWKRELFENDDVTIII